MVLQKRSAGRVTGSGSGHWDDVIDFLSEGRQRFPYSYIVFTDDTYYYALNGETGVIDYGGESNEGGADGTSASSVIQAAIDALTSGGLVKLLAGTFNLGTTGITIKDNVGVRGEGQEVTIINYTGTSDAVTFAEIKHDMELSELKVECDNASSGNAGLNIKSCNFVKVERVWFKDVQGTFSYGIYHGGGFFSNFIQNRVEGFDKNVYLTRHDAAYSRCSHNNFFGGQIKNGRTYNIETVVLLANHNVFQGVEIKITTGSPTANALLAGHNHVWIGNWMEMGVSYPHWNLADGLTQNQFIGNIYSGGSTPRFNLLGAVTDIYVMDINAAERALWRNSGTATITSGNTYITINHGLCYTPAAADFDVRFLENPTNDPGPWWVDNITSTQARINVRSNPGASNLDLAWTVGKFNVS